MAGDCVFAVYPYQFPPAPGAGAEVLNLPGFLKRLTGQHLGLAWGGDICLENGYVVGVTQAGGAMGGRSERHRLAECSARLEVDGFYGALTFFSASVENYPERE
jgi:hypothetical protein